MLVRIAAELRSTGRVVHREVLKSRRVLVEPDRKARSLGDLDATGAGVEHLRLPVAQSPGRRDPGEPSSVLAGVTSVHAAVLGDAPIVAVQLGVRCPRWSAEVQEGRQES